MKRVRLLLEGKLWGFIPIKWTVTVPIPPENVPVMSPVSAGPLRGTLTITTGTL